MPDQMNSITITPKYSIDIRTNKGGDLRYVVRDINGTILPGRFHSAAKAQAWIDKHKHRPVKPVPVGMPRFPTERDIRRRSGQRPGSSVPLWTGTSTQLDTTYTPPYAPYSMRTDNDRIDYCSCSTCVQYRTEQARRDSQLDLDPALQSAAELESARIQREWQVRADRYYESMRESEQMDDLPF